MIAQITENALLDKWLSARMVGLGPDEACELIDDLKARVFSDEEVENRVRDKVDKFIETALDLLSSAEATDVVDDEKLAALREHLSDGVGLSDCW